MKVGDLVKPKHKYSRNEIGLGLIVKVEDDFYRPRITDLYNATGNEKLILILNNLREQMYRYRIEYIKDYSSHLRLIEEHETIIESLKNHDKEKATYTICNHIDNQEMTVINSIKSNE